MPSDIDLSISPSPIYTYDGNLILFLGGLLVGLIPVILVLIYCLANQSPIVQLKAKKKKKHKTNDKSQQPRKDACKSATELVRSPEALSTSDSEDRRSNSYSPYSSSAKLREDIARAGTSPSVVRICFTGGPCAGKTTALASCAQQLNQLGIKTFVVPEAATMLNRGGARIANTNLDAETVVKFQISLLKTQMILEDTFADIARAFYPTERVVVLCDRGAMDGAAYTPGPMWEVLLNETGMTNSQLRDQRYDMVLHLVTAADGAREFYTLANNESRYEDIDQAIDSDRRTQMAWIGQPYYA